MGTKSIKSLIVHFKPLFISILAIPLLYSAGPGTAAPRRPVKHVTPKLEDLPQRALDTLDTSDPETKVILYSNNTWSYYRPSLQALDELPVYREHWDTTQVFAYRSIELADLPPVTDLKLISSLSDFHYPVMGKVLSKYGRRGRRNHNGVDIPLQIGEPVYATFDGRIRYSKYNTGGFGNLVIIRHRNGLETWYAHLTKRNVETEQYVKAGQIIGFIGSTGRSRGPHLHYEMRYCDQTFDPEFIVDFETGQLRYQTFALEKSFFNINSRASDQLEEDDEWDDSFKMLASESGENTSEEILERITNPQKSQKSQPTGLNPSNAVYHTIRQGDMLSKLAVRYGVSIDQICRLNGISRNTVLRLGRKLRIK